MTRDILNLFLKSRQDLAEGMSFTEWETYPWGITFSWEYNPLLSANFAYISESVENLDDLVDWFEFIPNSKIYSEVPLDINYNSEKFSILQGDGSKVSPPIFPELNIKKFSFKSRDLKYEIDQFSRRIANLFTNNKHLENSIDKYIRAIVHMHDGVIWTLEDQNEQIVAGLVVSNYELMGSRFYLLSVYNYQEKVWENNILEDLIALFLNSNRKNNYFVIERENTSQFEMFKALGFKDILSFPGYLKE